MPKKLAPITPFPINVTAGPAAVSVIGLGKLGLPLAACYAAMGCRVIGVDINEAVVDGINRGEPHVVETNLAHMMTLGQGRLTATTDWSEAVGQTNISFIIVPTPSEPNGRFTAKYVIDSCRSIGEAARMKNSFHLVVVCSTVMPGTMEAEVRPALEKASRKRVGTGIGLCYSPRFIALGSVVQDFLNPDLVLIGEGDQRSGRTLEEFYGHVHENEPRIARMSFSSAELCKLAVNTFVTTKISFANMLTALCESLPGANVDDVTGALGLDTRIGPKTLKGGIGYGGPCFPRDNVALTQLGRELDVPVSIPAATDEINRGQVSRIQALVQRYAPPNGTVGILGLAYKPHTNVVEESQGLQLARNVAASGGLRVVAYDPLAMEQAGSSGNNFGVELAPSMEACASQADVLVLMTPWPEFQKLEPGMLRQGPRKPVLIDCWRMWDSKRFAGSALHIPLGVGLMPDTEASARAA
ncbi:MAG: UDP-glucose/GDP-mannose dehydrogenase family protein [Chloroflexi bacterium]|nr:UDP-glucose/GDP-mannose dehydrogenase family protein [Chloroflexota bacterium]